MEYLRLAVLLVTPVALLAEEPLTATVAGVVKDAASRLPLEGVTVWVGQARATTDELGQFRVTAVEPGSHWISAHDDRRAAAGGTWVQVNSGEVLDTVTIHLKTGGSIAGRILDDHDEPVAGAAVLLLGRRFEGGEIAFEPIETVTTNQHGEYRFERVPSERGHLILAKYRFRVVNAATGSVADPEKRPRVLVPTFYPGTEDTQSAESIVLSSGESRVRMDIRMTKARAYCIDGTVDTAGRPPVTTLTVSEQMPLAGTWKQAAATTPVLPTGAFSACGLHPGDYRLAAASEDESQRFFASAEIAITSSDVHNVKLPVRPRMKIHGEALWDPPLNNKEAVKVRIGFRRESSRRAADEEGSDAGGGVRGVMSLGGLVSVPGEFDVGPADMGDYGFDVSDVPNGCYVKEATFAGANILGGTVRVARSDGGRLRLVLGCDGGSVSARVTDREGHAVSDATLYVMPAEGSPAELARSVRVEQVTGGWSGVVGSLRPGRYLALASSLQLDGTAEAVLKLWNRRSQATEVTVTPGGAAQLSVTVDEAE